MRESGLLLPCRFLGEVTGRRLVGVCWPPPPPRGGDISGLLGNRDPLPGGVKHCLVVTIYYSSNGRRNDQ